MYQHIDGTVSFYFEDPKEALDFFNKAKNFNLDKYRKEQIQKGFRKSYVNQMTEYFYFFTLESTEEDVVKPITEGNYTFYDVNIGFEYDFDVYVDDGAIENLQTMDEIRQIFDEYAEALGYNEGDIDYNDDNIDLDNEDRVWDKYKEEKDYNPWEDNYDPYDDY